MTAAQIATLAELLSVRTENEVMDALQDRGGLISDNCITAGDVPESCAERAIRELSACASSTNVKNFGGPVKSRAGVRNPITDEIQCTPQP